MQRTRIIRNSPNEPWTYSDLDRYQVKLADQIRSKNQEGELIFSELAPVVTFGRRHGCYEQRDDVKVLPSEFHIRGIELYETSRGGLATYHGTGQWVVFLVDRLDRLSKDPKGVRDLVGRLLNVCLASCRAMGVDAEIRLGTQAGVWGKHGKLASVGIQIDRGVVQHGIAINGFKTRESFFGIKPCGLNAEPEYLISSKPESIQEEEFLSLRKKIDNAFAEFF